MAEISFLILFFLFLIPTISATIDFYKLKGAFMYADPIDAPIQGKSENECAQTCLNYFDKCIGFQFIKSDGTCIHLTTVRNIQESNKCNFYIRDYLIEQTSIDPFVSSRNTTDQLIFYGAYGSTSACPQNFEDKLTFCSLEMTETKCNEYADFFNATFDGTNCIINGNRPQQWYCAPKLNPEKLLFSTIYSGFCYFKTTVSTNDITAFTQQCQSVSANSYPLTICSASENEFVASMTTTWPIMLSLFCPANTSTVYNWANNDGDCTFRNWYTPSSTPGVDGIDGEPNDYTNTTQTVAIMSSDEFWYDEAVGASTSGTYICKENALTLAEYSAICQSVDNCEQL